MEFLSNISNYSLKDIKGTNYKHEGNIVKTVYSCSYNDGDLESLSSSDNGILSVTVENNKITEIYYKTANYENTTKYVYEFENPDFPKDAIDWFDRYHMA